MKTSRRTDRSRERKADPKSVFSHKAASRALINSSQAKLDENWPGFRGEKR